MESRANSFPPFNAAFERADHPFIALMQQPHVALAQTDAAGRFVRINRRWAEILGYAENELLELSVKEITHSDSWQSTADNIARLQAGTASHYVLEKKYLRKDGAVFWASTTVSAIRDEAGLLAGLVALVVDLSDQRRSRLVVESQNEALQLIISGAPLTQVFDCLIAVVEAEGVGIGSVMLLDSDTGVLRHGSAPSLPEVYNRAIDGIPVKAGVGTCVAAAADNGIIITPDIATAPGWRKLRHLPLALGLRAAWSMPIVASDGNVLGTFGTYFRTCRQPSAAEIEMVGMLAKTAALAIERRRSDENFRGFTRSIDRQQRLYETVLSNTPDLIYVFNLEHRFTYANRALLALWGKTWDESIGKNCLELGYEPWHAEMHDREIEQVIVTKRPIRGEVAFNGTNGRRFYDYIFSPVIGVDGEVEAVAGTTRDITDQHKAAGSAQFLADLAQDLAIISDERHIIRHTVAVVGRHLFAHRCYFVECLESENLVKLSENWVRDDAPSLAGSLSLFDFGGAAWWAQYSKGDFSVEDTESDPLIGKKEAANYAAANIRSYAVQPIKITGEWTVVLAVTERHPRRWTMEEKQLLENVAARVWPLVERARSDAALRVARDEALAASRAKDDFLATLSHELRTPLNPVLLLASEAAANPALSAEVRADFEIIVRNVTLESRLIDDLLDLTSITHRKLPLQLRPIDVHAVLQQAISNLRSEIKQNYLTLAVRLDASRSFVSGDEVRLHQIFWNLLKNAAKFTPPGGSITIVTSIEPAKPGLLKIVIADTGLGLTSAELGRLFNPFTQGEHSESGAVKRYGGLGLGLAISRRLVELHGGTISAHSRGRDQGATFEVELPLVDDAESVSAPHALKTESASIAVKKIRRILLVEDHTPSRLALARLLANRKIEVVHAGSVAEALEQAAAHPVDLVISDVGLPDGTGHDVILALRERHGLRGIALSGYGTEADIAKSIRAGFSAHLTKPIQAHELDKALAQATLAQ